jgi:capsular polysaccharide export protein
LHADKFLTTFVPSTGGKKTFVVYCEKMRVELPVFLRMRNGLAARGWSLIVITELLSVWCCARSAGITCFLLRRVEGNGYRLAPIPSAGAGTDRLSDIDRVRKFQSAVWATLERICNRHSIGAIGLWNGLRPSGLTATAFARTNAIPLVFFELGNIEPKLFVDPEGVNFASRLARDPSLLDVWTVTDEEIAAWRKSYETRKLLSGSPPQAKSLWKPNPWFPLDWLGAVLLRVPQSSKMRPFKKLQRKLNYVFSRPIPNVKPAGPYVFLPLQVSSDTNLVLFSRYDNYAAIAVAAKRAKELGCIFVIKPHPAEYDQSLVRKISTMCAKQGYMITSFNTTELVLGAEEVVTINSTVGLEAILLDKKVTILGDSLYGSFSKRQAAAYVLRYLIDFDPFGKAPASESTIDRILNVIEAQVHAVQALHDVVTPLHHGSA